MIISINQPAYLPWLGYFDRIAKSDAHVVLDHVQFEKNSMTNRNRIRTKDAEVMLTVPVRTKGRFGALPIDSVKIDNTANWSKKHWNSLCQNYAKTAFFAEHEPFFAEIYESTWECLTDLLRVCNAYLLKALGIATPMVSSSELSPTATKSELVQELCTKLGADTYLSGPFGRDYLDLESFEAAGICVLFHDYEHPIYKQRHAGFRPCMSVVDLLFNHGPESLNILTGNAATGGGQ
ncbi:WbqC family protein [Pseudodesulfovibrio sp.]|nr:WbqC family protein [Pseudodesulfovibrio sp.]